MTQNSFGGDFCVSVLTVQGLSIQQKNVMASAVSTVPVNSVAVNVPITIKRKHAVSKRSRESAGIWVHIMGCHAR
jgi:hypothetical protein